MALIKWFKEISKEDITIAGGKGANLSELYNLEIPVPPGFVVTAEAYKKFLEETQIAEKIYQTLDNLNVDDSNALHDAAEQIQETILSSPIPAEVKNEIIEAYDNLNVDIDVYKMAGKQALDIIKAGRDMPYVAVRSSATAEDLPSISRDECILIKINNRPYFRRIEEIYDLVNDGTNYNLKIPAMKNNKIQWVKVKSLYRHRAKKREKVYKIKTESGREIVVSPNHTLIVLDENTLEPKEVTSIHELNGNEKLPTINKLPILDLKQKEIDVLDYIGGDDIVENNGTLKIKNRSTNWKIQSEFPRRININKNFAYFLGVYCAEGSIYGNNEIIITSSNNEIMKKIIQFVSSLNLYNNQKINKHSLRFYNKTFVRFLNNAAGKPEKNIKGKGRICKNKKVPEFIFGWDRELIGEFLRGCFDGDGFVGKEALEYCSTSKMLISGVIKLLEMLGLEWNLRKKGNAFTIRIKPPSFERFSRFIGFESKVKQKRLNNLIKKFEERKNHPELLNTIQISSELSKTLRAKLEESLPKQKVLGSFCPSCSNKINKSSKYLGKERLYCKKCHKAFYEKNVIKKEGYQYVYYDEKGRFLKNMTPWNKGFVSKKMGIKKLKRLLADRDLQFKSLHDSVKWDQIKKIKELDYNDYVYDFCVPGVENFAAGIGGIITHNSASFAGQQATFLNVKGNTDLIRAVQKCWASLFTARAIFYRVKNNFDHKKVFIAVIVQKMVNSSSSGVVFSINPVTNNENEILIEAGFGLGETVVSGAITPDQYMVDKESLDIKDKKINPQKFMHTRDPRSGATIKKNLFEEEGEKQKISDHEIKKLARFAKQIEDHYNFAQDIEFAIENAHTYIVQTRPVTTLKKPVGAEEKVAEEKVVEEKPEEEIPPEEAKEEITEEKPLFELPEKEEVEEKPAEETEEEPSEEKQPEEKEILLTGLAASPHIGSGPVKIIHGLDDLSKIEQGDIAVTVMTNPDMTPAMKKVNGIVTDTGGTTAHAAIISREMGLACVVGTQKATHTLKEGQIVTVDGINGKVYEGKVEIEEEAKAIEEEEKIEELKKEELETVTEIKVNVDMPEYADEAAATGADGVGLMRCEFLILKQKEHPYYLIEQGRKEELVNNLYEGIKKIAAAFKGKSVWYRTLDAPAAEFKNLVGGESEPEEENPMMGWRSIRRGLDQPELLKAEFEAIKKVHDEGFTNVGVMLPLVISIDEIKKSKEILNEVGLEPCENIDFGIMIETPASVQLIKEICEEGVDFVSFGTNDLTQFTLAVDRDNAKIQKLYNEMHPAVLKQIKYVINTCKKYNVETSICGQAASNEKMAEFLVKAGIDSISANIDAVKKIRYIVAKTEKKLLLKAARKDIEF